MRLSEIENSDPNITVGGVIKWGLIAVVVVTVLGIGSAYLGMFSRIVTAPAAVVSKTMDPTNIISNYEWFYDMNAAYQARLPQITSQAKSLAYETDSKERIKLRSELTAMQQVCRDLVTKYNANSQKINRSLFKSVNLPAALQLATCENGDVE